MEREEKKEAEGEGRESTGHAFGMLLFVGCLMS